MRIPKYADVPDFAKGPPVDPAKGYRTQSLGKDLYMVTENAYQAMFLVYETGVVLVDSVLHAPSTFAHLAGSRVTVQFDPGAEPPAPGERVALFHARGRSLHVPPFAAGKVVETTGAGDAFVGGFAAALADGADPLETARFGSATAGISVTRPGTAPAMPRRAEIEALLREPSSP